MNHRMATHASGVSSPNAKLGVSAHFKNEGNGRGNLCHCGCGDTQTGSSEWLEVTSAYDDSGISHIIEV